MVYVLSERLIGLKRWMSMVKQTWMRTITSLNTLLRLNPLQDTLTRRSMKVRRNKKSTVIQFKMLNVQGRQVFWSDQILIAFIRGEFTLIWSYTTWNRKCKRLETMKLKWRTLLVSQEPRERERTTQFLTSMIRLISHTRLASMGSSKKKPQWLTLRKFTTMTRWMS
jgi:hypothetical protein